MVTLEQAFSNVDNVVANASMTRKEHMILADSLRTIKVAAMPLTEVPEDEGDGGDGRTD